MAHYFKEHIKQIYNAEWEKLDNFKCEQLDGT